MNCKRIAVSLLMLLAVVAARAQSGSQQSFASMVETFDLQKKT